MNLSKHSGVAALVLLAFGFGAIAIVARYLSYSFSLFQQLYLTLGAAFIISLFLFRTNITVSRLRTIPTKDWLVMILRVVIGYLVGASLYRESLVLTKISNVTFIQSIPFAAIFGFFFFKETFTFKKVLLLFVAYTGVLLIAVNEFSASLQFGKGELFSLISTAFFSLSYVSRKWMTNTLNDKEIAQILLFLGTVALISVSAVKGEGIPIIPWEGGLVAAIFLNGFFNAINIFLINYGFKHVKVVVASNILTLESVFALLLAFIFYRELPTIKELFGGVLIIGSVFFMNKLEEK